MINDWTSSLRHLSLLQSLKEYKNQGLEIRAGILKIISFQRSVGMG